MFLVLSEVLTIIKGCYLTAVNKTLSALLLLACFLLANICHQAVYASPASDQEGDSLSVAGDGTATAIGIVLENNHGCRLDGACYLRLRISGKQARVIYHPGEGEAKINRLALRQGEIVQKGARVKAYGRYRKSGDLAIIETYSSDAFYIHVLPNSP